MKKIIFMAFCFLAHSGWAQTAAQRCTEAVTPVQFESIKNQVQQQINPTLSLQKAREFARMNCFTAAQAGELMLLVSQDHQKAEIGRLCYPNVVDKANFSQVYDFFSNAPALASLARYVQDINTAQSGITETPRITRDQILFPVFETYIGRRAGNQLPQTEAQFAQFRNSVQHQNIYIQLQKVLDPDRSRFFSMAQVMELALLFTEESQRIQVLQHYVRQTVDIDHFPYGFQLLGIQANKTSYIQNVQFYTAGLNTGGSGNTGGGGMNCSTPVTPAELATIRASLDRARITSVRIKQYKAAVKGKCFSVDQLRSLIGMFGSFDRLDILKYSYDFCTDKQNYYSLSDLLVSMFDAEKFAVFLQGK